MRGEAEGLSQRARGPEEAQWFELTAESSPPMRFPSNVTVW